MANEFDFTGTLKFTNGRLVKILGPDNKKVDLVRRGPPSASKITGARPLVLMHSVGNNPAGKWCWAFYNGAWICWPC